MLTGHEGIDRSKEAKKVNHSSATLLETTDSPKGKLLSAYSRELKNLYFLPSVIVRKLTLAEFRRLCLVLFLRTSFYTGMLSIKKRNKSG